MDPSVTPRHPKAGSKAVGSLITVCCSGDTRQYYHVISAYITRWKQECPQRGEAGLLPAGQRCSQLQPRSSDEHQLALPRSTRPCGTALRLPGRAGLRALSRAVRGRSSPPGRSSGRGDPSRAGLVLGSTRLCSGSGGGRALAVRRIKINHEVRGKDETQEEWSGPSLVMVGYVAGHGSWHCCARPGAAASHCCGQQGHHEPAACPGCQEGQQDPGVH